MESDRLRLVPATLAALVALLLPPLSSADEPDWRSLDELAKGHVRRAAPPDNETTDAPADSPVPSHESTLGGSRGEAEARRVNPFRAPAPPKPWNVSLILEGQFDTNAVAPTEIIAPGAIDLVGTWLMTTVLSGGYEFRPNDDLEIHLDALWYAEYHDRYAKFDLDSVKFSPWAQWWLTPMLSVGVKGAGTWQTLGGEPLLSVLEGGPFATYAEGDWTQTTLAYAYKNKEYDFETLPNPLDPDSSRHTVSISQDVLLPETSWIASLSYALSAVDADGSDYDCDLHLVTLSIGGPLALGVKTSFETSLLVAPFHHDNLLSFPPFTEDREDKVMRFTVRLERAIMEHLSVYGYAMHMDNDSTLRAYTYDREMYGFGLVLYW
ncbi:MAG: hypothetical protein AAB434_04475 [Planctomycetota bacterium]